VCLLVAVLSSCYFDCGIDGGSLAAPNLPSPTIGKNPLEVDFRLDNIEKSPPDGGTSWSLVDILDNESRDAISPRDSHHPVLEGAVTMLLNAETGTPAHRDLYTPNLPSKTDSSETNKPF
jgi:hypothetical protein